MNKITDIVFDVGRVLIDVNYDTLFQFLWDHGASVHTEQEFIRQTDMLRYERGQIDDDTFLARLNNLFTTPPGREAIINAWQDLFTPIDDMLALANRLKSDYGVYLLSNTNSLHWQYVVPQYKLDQISHGLLTSFELGVMKPDPAIFRHAEQQFGLQAENTVFIDDIQENATGAIACGWYGIHHISTIKTVQLLRTLGVAL